jgi:hypothetical protein
MMLASPRIEDSVRAFFDDMLGLIDFQTVSKDPLIYPAFAGAAGRDAREQALQTIVSHLVAEKGDYRDLFTTRRTFISPDLSPLYGIPAPATGWVAYTFPDDSPRAGLLTEIGFLAMYSHPGRSSVTKRGRALRELLLCQHVPDPPPNVDFSIIEDPKAHFHTARERLAAHATNPVCAGCHRMTDPIGLTLENFDGAGQFRATEKGATIDASGSLDAVKFNDAAGLGRALHDSPLVTSCLVNRTFAYAIGSSPAPDDRPVLAYLENRFAADGYKVPDLLRTIALSHIFSEIAEPNGKQQSAALATGQHDAVSN